MKKQKLGIVLCLIFTMTIPLILIPLMLMEDGGNEEMVIFNYAKDVDIDSDLYPINTQLCVEYGTYIYFVPFQDTLTIRKLDTSDGTSSLIVTETGSITKFYFDRDNDKLYYYYNQANFSYVDLTDDSITDLTPTLDACEDLFVYDGDLFAVDTSEDDLTYYKYNAVGPAWDAVGTISEGANNWYDVDTLAGGLVFNAPFGICFDGTYFYVNDAADATVYIFNSALDAYIGKSKVGDLGGNDDVAGMCYDDTYICVVDFSDQYLYRYNTALDTLEDSHDIGTLVSPSGTIWGVEWDGTYYYFIDDDGYVYKVNSALDTLIDTYDVGTVGSMPVDADTRCICTDGTYFYIVDLQNATIYKFDNAFSVRLDISDIGALGGNDDPHDICWDGSFFNIIDKIDRYVYKYSSNLITDLGLILYSAIISDKIYTIYQYVGQSAKIYVKDLDDSSNPSLLETLASDLIIPYLENQRGVSVSSDNDTLYFVMKDEDDELTYLCTYVISTDTFTKGSEYNVALGLNRNTDSTANPPFALEKGFGVETSVNDLMIYQIARTGIQLYKISDLSNSTDFSGFVIKTITDTYLIAYDGTDSILASFQDFGDYIVSAKIYHAERDYPTATIVYDSQTYYIEESMFIQFVGNIRINGSTAYGVRFEGYARKPRDLNAESNRMKIVDLVSPSMFDLRKSFSGTLEEGGFDDWLDTLIASFKYITKGVIDAATLTLPRLQRNSEKDNLIFIDQGAVGEGFTWRVRPTGELDWTAGDDDSGINYDQDTPIWEVEIAKKQIVANSITIRGGFFDGTQITSESDQGQDYESQQEIGIIEAEITISWISTVALANSYANTLLGILGITYEEVSFTVLDETNGFIPSAEEITLADSNKSITSAQYKINQCVFDDKTELSEYIVSSIVLWDLKDLKQLYENELADQVNQINDRTMKKTGWETGISYSDCTLSFSTPTFTLTLVADDMSYWIDGKLYTFSANQTVDITDTEGIWFIYFDGDTLTSSQTPWEISDADKAFVAFMYYDADANTATIFWEFHSWETSPIDHDKAHHTLGTQYASGFDLTEASDEISLSNGIGWDEDIKISVVDGAGSGLFEQNISGPGYFPVWYRSGATAWRKYTAGSKPIYDNAGGDNVHYNQFSTPNWLSTASQGANRYVAYWVCLVNGIAGQTVISIMGQSEPAILATAQDLSYNDLDLTGLPFQEITQLWKVIYKTDSTYVEVEDLRGTNTPGGVYIPPAGTPIDVIRYNNYIHLQDQKTSGSHGGSSSSGSWLTRVLTTEVSDEGGLCTLSSNQFILEAGTYLIMASSPIIQSGRHNSRLYNTTGAAVLLSGTSEYNSNAGDNDICTRSFINGIFTIAASQALEIQYQVQHAYAGVGLGLASGGVFTVAEEIYTDVQLWKVG